MALQMTWQQRSLHPRGQPLGLRNLGNTCYLNSVLQCLTYTPPLAQFCLSSQHSSLCKALIANREKDCPFCIMERQIARSLTLDAALDSPSKIQKCLALFSEHFRVGRQEDAHEFLRYVIDACHDACLKLLKRIAVPKDPAADAGPTTVMKEVFGGALLSQVKCGSCKGESDKTDEIMDISLDLFQSNSLKDALARYFQPEVLDGSNKYSCEKCKKLSVAKKQLFLLRAPNVLVIQLKRFEGMHGGKINRNIEFEEVLVLSNFMHSAAQDSQSEYNLFGSIVHSGYSPDSGHYYAYIKDASGRWYCCNDAHVSLSSTREVLSEKVYILFYLRNNQSPRPIKNGPLCNGVKFSDSNGGRVSPCQKSVELLNQPYVKSNGALSSKNNSVAMLKNGRMSTSPKIKPFSLKNGELKRVTSNGNGNLKLHNGVSSEKSNNGGQSQQNKIVTEYSSMDESKMGTVEVSSAPNSNTTENKVECNDRKKLSVPNGIGGKNLLKGEVDEHNDNQIVAAAECGSDCDFSSNHMINKYNCDILDSNRKVCDVEKTEVPVSSTKDAPLIQSTHPRKHSPDELEKVKEMLSREAKSTLQSCGWSDKVHMFMHKRKQEILESSQDNNEPSRKQLKIDAKDFTSQIPESLKARLIELLSAFYQGDVILDS